MNELLTLSSVGILILLADMFNAKKMAFPIAMIGLATSIAFSINDWHRTETLYGMLRMDKFALAFNVIMCSATFLWCVLSEDYFEEREAGATDRYALVFFALTGGLCMVSYTNMVMLFIGIEILSIAMYVLAGSHKYNRDSNEAAFKYFLMGSFASGFLLFGIALLYGVTGSFEMYAIAEKVKEGFHYDQTALLVLGLMMMTIGMAFKLSVAPFHFWAPDVYQGSPTIVTAFMATVVKMAAFGAFYRLLTAFVMLYGSWSDILTVMVVLTLFISNVSAVLQHNVKRILAYSSIAHAGYMLMACLSSNSTGDSAILYYTAVYSLSSMAAFMVLYLVDDSKEGRTDIGAFHGLAKKQPILALAMTLALLSMAGIPPLSGFMAKYYIFAEAVHEGMTGLVFFAICMSLVSLYYYMKIIIAMYFHDADDHAVVNANPLQVGLLAVSAIAMLFLGIFPDSVYQLLN
jgi:NADH-quinone oxidoreductase subunit N